MRRIAIDVREACRERVTGKGRWTQGLVSELLARGEPMLLVTDAPLPPMWSGADEMRVAGSGIGWHLRAARAIDAADVTAFLATTSYIIPCLLKRVPAVTVVHDLIAFRGEPHDARATRIERFTLGRAVRRSKAVLAISDATKKDLLARFPRLDASKVTSVYAGPAMPPSAARRPDGLTVLCIGTLCPRKNQLRLIRGFSLLPSPLRKEARLVLVGGRGWDDDAIIEAARKTPGVEWRDYVTDAACEELLATCVCVAFPSLYEGFGLPVLDGMLRGIPVLTSARGSLAEVAGDAAVVVDPEDETAITAGLSRLLSDALLREDLSHKGLLQAKKYSWQRTADLVVQAVDGIDKKRGESAR